MLPEPLQHLVQTHEDILGFLEHWEQKAEAAATQDAATQAGLLGGLLAFERSVLTPHTRQEEDILFPLIQLPLGGPVHCMLSEHREMETLLAKLGDCVSQVAAGEADVFRTQAMPTARAFIATLRGHIEKENEVLFPMSAQVLDPAQLEQVREKMAASLAAARG